MRSIYSREGEQEAEIKLSIVRTVMHGCRESGEEQEVGVKEEKEEEVEEEEAGEKEEEMVETQKRQEKVNDRAQI